MSSGRPEVVVVGAGMVGLAVANALALRNVSVALVDRAPRHRTNRPELWNGAIIQALVNGGFGSKFQRSLTPVYRSEHHSDPQRVDRRIHHPAHATVQPARFTADLMGALHRRVQTYRQERVVKIIPGIRSIQVLTESGLALDGNLAVLATGIEPSWPENFFGLAPPMEERLHLAFDVDGELNDTVDALTFVRPSLGEPIGRLSVFRCGRRLAGSLTSAQTQSEFEERLLKRPLRTLMTKNPFVGRALGAAQAKSPTTRWALRRRLPLPAMDRLVIAGGETLAMDFSADFGGLLRLAEAQLLTNVYIPIWLERGAFGRSDIQTFYEDPNRTRLMALAQAWWNERRPSKAHALANRFKHAGERLRARLDDRLRHWPFPPEPEDRDPGWQLDPNVPPLYETADRLAL